MTIVIGVRLPPNAKAGDAIQFDARSLGAAAPVTFTVSDTNEPGQVVARRATVYRD